MIAAGTSATHTQAVLNNLIGYVATSQPCYVTLPHTINRMVLIVEVRSVMYLYIYIYVFLNCVYIYKYIYIFWYIYIYLYLYVVSTNLADKRFACEAGIFEEGCAPGHGEAC